MGRGTVWYALSTLTRRIDNAADEVQNDVFFGSNVHSWMNDKTQVSSIEVVKNVRRDCSRTPDRIEQNHPMIYTERKNSCIFATKITGV